MTTQGDLLPRTVVGFISVVKKSSGKKKFRPAVILDKLERYRNKRESADGDIKAPSLSTTLHFIYPKSDLL